MKNQTPGKNSGRPRPGCAQDGVALAILVWFLAAMSILVAGIVMQARVDIKLAQLHAARARVEAAADGAIHLALADMMQRETQVEFSGRTTSHAAYTLGGVDVSVSFTPLSGLVDLNLATQELLFALFSAIEEVDENAAHELTANVVEWRSAASSADVAGRQASGDPGAPLADDYRAGLAGAGGPRHARFETIEDLLLVQGIDRRIFEALRDSVYVNQVGQSGVDWLGAPVSVLRVLGDMDEEALRDLAASRLTGNAADLVAPRGLDLAFQQVADIPAYRADALAVFDDTVFRRRRWVDRSRGGQDGLPWRFFRTEALRVLPRDDQAGEAGEEAAGAGN